MATPRRKACVECRQQKIRCDVEQHKEPHDPCGRCRKMSLECKILPTSTRSLRQTKAEMRRELEELRWNLRQGASSHATASPATDLAQLAGQDVDARTDDSRSVSPKTQSRPSTRHDSANMSTLPRRIAEYLLEGAKIDACFSLFFADYHELLPILNSPLTPNECYDLSPFLFWSIVVTGSRKYEDDVTVLEKVSQALIPLAFASMALRSPQIPLIQALLILSNWRLPTVSMYKDMTHLMCGCAVNLATQIGLHITGVGQDFARIPLKHDQDEQLFRARLWTLCVIMSNKTSCAEGLPPLTDFCFDCHNYDGGKLLGHMPDGLRFLHELYMILLRAMVNIGKTNLQSLNCNTPLLRSLISVFDRQLLDLTNSTTDELALLQLKCARVHVLAYSFFEQPACPELFSLCLSVIEDAARLRSQLDFASLSQSLIDRTVTLAGFAILRLIHSYFAQHLDLKAGERAFFKAVGFLKSVSLQQGDIGARTALIMSDLWGSNRVFRCKDGRIDSLRLRLRTRLSMSVSYDMFWYWREEFGNMHNPYSGDDGPAPSYKSNQAITSSKLVTAQSLSSPGFTDDVVLTQHSARTAPSAPTMPPEISTSNTSTSFADSRMPPGTAMAYDPWNGSDYSMLAAIGQYPDYEWAAGFDFSNVPFPGVAVAPILPGELPGQSYPLG